MIPKSNIDNNSLLEENEALKQQITKHVGMLARHERSIMQLELKLSSEKIRVKSLEEEVRLGRVKHLNESARSEKFKLAYESLLSHPAIRTGRKIKNMFTGK